MKAKIHIKLINGESIELKAPIVGHDLYCLHLELPVSVTEIKELLLKIEN